MILGIDPGTEVSGVVSFDPVTYSVSDPMPAVDNGDLAVWLGDMSDFHDCLAIEMVASYGMAVGKSTFETVLWTGRFMEIFGWDRCVKIYRKDVKMELCGSMKAKDANVRRALFDRFPRTGGGKTPEVGTKKRPGPLYGVANHAVSALAVAVTCAARLS